MNNLNPLAVSDPVLTVAQAVADGSGVDWDAVESTASERDRRVIQQLRTLATMTARVPAPAMWGPLQLHERIGAGTFGSVHRAFDPRLEREVALKLLGQLTPDTNSGQAVSEARMLARVRHPNVVVVFGADVHDGRVGIWMELVRGRSLKDIVDAQGPLGAHESALLGRDVSRALAAVHAAGFVHGDIKAQNVMREEGGRTVLMDFGAAALLHGAIPALRGTPAYLAPELFAGGTPSRVTDVYSLGVLLWYLATGTFPVTGSSLEEFRSRHAANQRSRLRDIRPDLPAPFVRAVEAATAADPAHRPQTAGALEALLDEALGIQPRAWRWWIPAAALIAVLGSTPLWWPARQPGTSHFAARDSVAILPIKNLSQATDDYLSAGLTSDLIGSLSSLRELRVIAGPSVMRYADRTKTPIEIGKELGVSAVLDANIRRAGESIRVVAQLIDGRTGEQIWSDQFDSTLSAIVELRSDVANKIALALRGTLSTGDAAALSAGSSADPQTIDLCMRGRYERSRRTSDGLSAALRYFTLATERAPRFAPAHAGLADAYTTSGVYGYLPRRDAFDRAAAAAARAVTLDPNLAEAHAAMGYARKNQYAWQDSEKSFKQAIALKPSYAEAHQWYSVLLTQLGRFPEAATENRIALSLDPLSVGPSLQLASLLTMQKRYADAIAQYAHGLKSDNGFATAYRHLARTYTYSGDFAKALALFKEAQAKQLAGSEDAELKADLGYVYAVSGSIAEAKAIAAELTERFERNRDNVAGSVAAIHAGLGDHRAALMWLNKAFATGDPELGYLKVDPRWDSLRGYPEFANLMQNLGLKSQDH